MWCDERRGYGGPIHGSDADYVLTDARNCFVLPAELSFAVGAIMACNAGTAFSATGKLTISDTDTVVIFGQGPVGLAGTLFATTRGARVIGVELTLIGSFVLPVYMLWDMARFIVEHQLPLESLVTHRFPIDKAPEAFTLFDGGQTGKVLFTWP